MHPVADGVAAVVGYGLGYLAFVVREFEVHSSAVYVELFAEVFFAHRRAFEVPSGKSFAPRRGPVHDVFGRCLFPEGEIGGVALLALSVEFAGGGEQLIDVASGKPSVAVLAVEAWYVEIDGAFAFVGIAAVENFFDVFDLFDYVARGVRLYRWRQYVQGIHGLVVAVEVELHHFHRFELFEACFFCHFIFAVVGIVFKMAYVGYVAYIAHFVPEMPEITEEDVECYGRARVSEVSVAVDRRAAYIHSDALRMERSEYFFLTRQRVVDSEQRISHCRLVMP